MAKKVSKNARVAQRAANVGSGRDHVKVVKSVKDPKTGKYTYKEVIVRKDEVEAFFASK
jgi:ribosomal protein L32